MNMLIRKYAQKHVDYALSRVFYDAIEQEFDRDRYSSVYVCTYKNKIAVLKSDKITNSHFEHVIRIECRALTSVTKRQHLVELIQLLPKHLKLELERALHKIKVNHQLDFAWEFVHRRNNLKCQEYYENFLQSRMTMIRKTKHYNQLVDILARKLELNKERCSHYETSLLIGDVIRTLGYDINFDELVDISNAIYTSNILCNGEYDYE